MTVKVDTEPYKESSLSRIASTEGVEPKYLTISVVSPLSGQIIPLRGLPPGRGIETSNLKAPLVIGGFSLGKGRIYATEYGKVRGP